MGLAVSLDGFIEGPNGEYDWCLTDQDYGMSDFFSRIDGIFIGRKSYEFSLTMGDVSMPGFPKLTEYVFSNTLKDVKPQINFDKGRYPERSETIKNRTRKRYLVIWGASLTTSLLNLHLVDEINLAIHPVILGGGKPLFHDVRTRINLKHVDTKTYLQVLFH